MHTPDHATTEAKPTVATPRLTGYGSTEGGGGDGTDVIHVRLACFSLEHGQQPAPYEPVPETGLPNKRIWGKHLASGRGGVDLSG